MKKLFTFVAVAMLAVVTGNATVLWEENFNKGDDTYIKKAKTKSGEAWPYANQWFTGYEASDGQVAGSLYQQDYSNVESYGVSIRGKKLNGSTDKKSDVGLFFGANKEEEKNFVKFTGNILAATDGAYLMFDICSSESAGGDLNTMVLKVNDQAIAVPATTLGAQAYTSTVAVALPNEAINSIYFAFNNVPAQKFISKMWIADEAQAVENISVEGAKAMKVMENGQLVIIRNGVKYNAAGAVIE